MCVNVHYRFQFYFFPIFTLSEIFFLFFYVSFSFFGYAPLVMFLFFLCLLLFLFLLSLIFNLSLANNYVANHTGAKNKTKKTRYRKMIIMKKKRIVIMMPFSPSPLTLPIPTPYPPLLHCPRLCFLQITIIIHLVIYHEEINCKETSSNGRQEGGEGVTG